jgi:uncharacterized protein YkwD
VANTCNHTDKLRYAGCLKGSVMENQIQRYRLALIITFGLNVGLLLLTIYFYAQWRSGEEAQVAQLQGNVELTQDTPADPTFAPTAMPSPTLLPLPSDTPASEPEPTETATPIPAPTETSPAPPATLVPPTATAVSVALNLTPTLAPGPSWLRYTNLFRVQAGLPQLTENSAYSTGSQHHSRYMIQTNTITHGEQPTSPFFNQAGHDAALNGNLAVSNWDGASDIWPINYWMSAAFHALPMLDPRLVEIGYGLYRDPESSYQLTGTMHISSKLDLGSVPNTIDYPIFFPADGGETWILEYSLPEFPNPLEACSGYQRSTGPPIILQIGDGSLTPNVHASSFRGDGADLQHCVIHESNYVNSNDYFQKSGRTILNEQDAIVLIPRQPLTAGATYTVSIVVGEETYEWSFLAAASPGNY